MTKAVLFDVDGLVITGDKERFSERYAREYEVPIGKVGKFFTGKFKDCSFGRTDLKEEIKPYLEKWKWKGNVDDFLNYWFKTDSKINTDVIEIVQNLRKNDIKCYLATRQEKYRASYFWEGLKLKKCFDGMFCTCDIGYDKNQPEFWDEIMETLRGVKPEEVLFFDDSQKNVDFANSYGIKAYFYSGVDVLRDKIGSNTDQ